jgi:surface polysaccharide O-acyltransferase-like enzyme
MAARRNSAFWPAEELFILPWSSLVTSLDATQLQRDPALDLLRVVSLVLVIEFHVMMAADASSISAASSAAIAFTHALGPIRLTGLMLISGYFAAGSLLRRGPAEFLGTKLSGTGYPLAVWSLIMAMLLWLAGGEDRSFELLLSGVVSGHHIWFLRYLLLFFLITPLLVRSRATSILVVVLSGMISILIPERDPHLIAAMLHFFALGTLIPRGACDRLGRLSNRSTLLVAAIPPAWTSFAISMNVAFDWHSPWYVVQAYLLILSAILLCMAASKSSVSTLLQPITRYSLEIYILHYPILMVVQRVLEEARLSFWPVALILGLTVSILTAAAVWMSRKWKLMWLFKPPKLMGALGGLEAQPRRAGVKAPTD